MASGSTTFCAGSHGSGKNLYVPFGLPRRDPRQYVRLLGQTAAVCRAVSARELPSEHRCDEFPRGSFPDFLPSRQFPRSIHRFSCFRSKRGQCNPKQDVWTPRRPLDLFVGDSLLRTSRLKRECGQRRRGATQLTCFSERLFCTAVIRF